MRTRLVVAPMLAILVLAVIAPSALSSTTQTPAATPATAQISLEVYCYRSDVDADSLPRADAADQCSLLGEFGLVWEQMLHVLDAGGAVIETVLPQVVTDENAAGYPADGAWRAPEPVLPEGWAVIECPFGDVSDPTLTNGVGQTIQAENLTYEDRFHVVCYQLGDAPTPTPTRVPVPTRIDTGGGGTAGR